jgi:hypothetical protein
LTTRSASGFLATGCTCSTPRGGPGSTEKSAASRGRPCGRLRQQVAHLLVGSLREVLVPLPDGVERARRARADGLVLLGLELRAGLGDGAFAPGETTRTVTVEVKGDSKREASETFYLDLVDLSSSAPFAKNRGIGTILNDD